MCIYIYIHISVSNFRLQPSGVRRVGAGLLVGQIAKAETDIEASDADATPPSVQPNFPYEAAHWRQAAAVMLGYIYIYIYTHTHTSTLMFQDGFGLV